MNMKLDYRSLAEAAADEVRRILLGVDAREVEGMLELMHAAGRIFFAGAGRSRQMMSCTAMRFMHLGAQVALVGEPTAPAICAGDLLLISSGSGETATMRVIADKARAAGAKLGVITRSPDSSLVKAADGRIVLHAPQQSSQIGASSYEQACLILGDVLARMYAQRLGLSDPDAVMRTRHANLE